MGTPSTSWHQKSFGSLVVGIVGLSSEEFVYKPKTSILRGKVTSKLCSFV